MKLNIEITSLLAKELKETTSGYWQVQADGEVYSFGNDDNLNGYVFADQVFPNPKDLELMVILRNEVLRQVLEQAV